jgi:hypothetical protein
VPILPESYEGAPRRPLTRAALAAVEAKECRRVNRLLERSTRAMAVASAANPDAIAGMWPGCQPEGA